MCVVSADNTLPVHGVPCSGGCHGYHGPLRRHIPFPLDGWTDEAIQPQGPRTRSACWVSYWSMHGHRFWWQMRRKLWLSQKQDFTEDIYIYIQLVDDNIAQKLFFFLLFFFFCWEIIINTTAIIKLFFLGLTVHTCAIMYCYNLCISSYCGFSPFRDKQPREYYPQLGKLHVHVHCTCMLANWKSLVVADFLIFVRFYAPNLPSLSFSPVFIVNHASPDDFQPLSLREMHTELAANFQGAKVNIAGKCVHVLNWIYASSQTRCNYARALSV